MIQMLNKRRTLIIISLIIALCLSVFILFESNDEKVFQEIDCTRTCYNGILPGITTRTALLSYFEENKITPHRSYRLGDTTQNPVPLTYSWIPEQPEFFIQSDSRVIAVFGDSDVLQQLTIPTNITIEDLRQDYPEPDYIYETPKLYKLVYENLMAIFIFNKSSKQAETAYLLSDDSVHYWISSDDLTVNWNTFLSEISSLE